MRVRYAIYICPRGGFDERGSGPFELLDVVLDIGAAVVRANQALMRGEAVTIVPVEAA